jgi:hypothetical protein
MRKRNEQLAAIQATPEAWFEYACALMALRDTHGADFLTEPENLLVSAYQLDTCLQSSGLFSFFELQPCWAQFGEKAMKLLGLPELEQMLRHAAEVMELPPHATEDEIRTATRKLVNAQFEDTLDRLEPLEDAYHDEDGAIPAAFMAYVRANHDSLKQSNR